MTVLVRGSADRAILLPLAPTHVLRRTKHMTFERRVEIASLAVTEKSLLLLLSFGRCLVSNLYCVIDTFWKHKFCNFQGDRYRNSRIAAPQRFFQEHREPYHPCSATETIAAHSYPPILAATRSARRYYAQFLFCQTIFRFDSPFT